MAVATAAVSAPKAGFWVRVLAYLIDVVALIAIDYVLALVLSGGDLAAVSNLGTLVGIVYLVGFWSSYGGGQTLGMRVLGLRVVRTDGSQLTIVQALIRYVGLIIASIPLLIGLIWVAFDANKQGWHDKIAGTYVVKA
jgi:uncharacterized RDD family membrane protein YckC